MACWAGGCVHDRLFKYLVRGMSCAFQPTNLQITSSTRIKINFKLDVLDTPCVLMGVGSQFSGYGATSVPNEHHNC